TRAEKYRAIEMLAQSKNTFMIRGYVPENCIEAFCKILEERFCVSITVNDANEDLQPVLLKNNSFVEPVENLTTMYSLPSKRDIDPSAIMSIFYYVFFGMMLSDAGYGLLMILGSMFLIKKYKPEPRMKKNLKLFIYCGISTVFWGLMFGSFFGDSIATLSELFTGTKIIQKPLLFDPMQEATNLLILSLAFGLIQMICGLSVSFYMLWREKKKADAICDVGLWITALLGIACVAVGMVVPVMMMPGAIVAIASAAGILFTAGRKKKGPMKVLAGLKELYGSTNYVSDFMSYSRLMALGLTTGAMGSVFNMLSAMMGSGLLAIVPLIIIFVVGHGVNFALNALGAYVHTIRLQYVELFSKFYEGGGREYKPFSIEGKFTRISKKK
ncbi:MAG: V-type ATPase 116kDa subunit family protein, partial [Clostridia bacterium]|nr:V-type ATPase 116kDa subunit family protein [Clostridia bacterium]